ncbi:MAG: FKBP-type peptidyl-prolyl cis-trans isomerase [Victivallales bacterium]|nr:FKBP-type peptidyl-prolyl cis-trans isomerase [Victivallales bacterium]
MTDKELKLNYCLGLNFAMQLQQLPIDFDKEEFMRGFMDMLENKKPAVSQEEFSKAMRALQERINAENEHGCDCGCDHCGGECGDHNCGENEHKKAGDEYRAENAKKTGVVTTPSGLQIEMLKEGTGKSPKATDKVRVHYTGKLIDGSVFDSSVQRGMPAEFPLNGVIAGWTEGLQHLKEGGKAILTIAPELGYGVHGAGNVIPPHATLVFEVELLKVL